MLQTAKELTLRCAAAVGAMVLCWHVFLLLCMAHRGPLDILCQLHALVTNSLTIATSFLYVRHVLSYLALIE